MSRRGTMGLSLLFLSGLAQLALAQPDAVQSRLLDQFPLPLYWDNVEADPEWLEGVTPSHDPRLGMHRIQLAPGAATVVRLPSQAMLRVVRLTDQGIDPAGMHPTDLTLSLSQGTALFATQPWQVATGANPGLIAVPESDTPLLARILRPASSADPLDLALFVSRREPLGEIAPYRDLLALPGAGVELRRGVEAGGERFWPMEPQTWSRLRVQGPFRLALEARQRMGPTDREPALSWRIKLRLDDQPLTELAMTSAVEDRTPLFVDGQEQAASRLERAFVEIPPGDHELAMASETPLWLRLLRQETPDYLLPGFNAPEPSALELRKEGGDGLLQQWQTALRLAQDNSRRNTGLAGTALLRQLADHRPDYPALQPMANALAGRHLHYRDLPPAGAPVAQRRGYFLPQRLLATEEHGVMTVLPTLLKGAFLERLGQAMFTMLPMADGAESSPPVELRTELWFDSDQHTPNHPEALLPWLAEVAELESATITVAGHADASGHRQKNERLAQERARSVHHLLLQHGVAEERVRIQAQGDRQPRAGNDDPEGRRRNRRVELVATGLPRQGNSVQRYRLPERPVPSQVRILLDQEGATGATLLAQIDQAAPVALQWIAARPVEEMAPSPTEAALYLQAEQTGTRQPTLQGALPPGFLPAPLQQVGVATLPVPPGARELRLRQEQGRTPLWVAVQFQDGKPFALTPADHAALTDRLAGQGKNLLSLAHGLLATLDTPADDGERETVRTLWHPLLRLLRAEQNQFAVGVALPAMVPPKQADPPRYRQLLAQAARLEDDGDWLNALELRHSAFALAPDKAEALAGWLAGTENLLRLGEPFLAEQRLKALLLLPEAAPLHPQVRGRLIQLYQQQQDDESLRTLYATLFARHGEADDLRSLIPLLVADGDHELALLAGVLLPAEQRPFEAMMRAALATGWLGLAEAMGAAQPTAAASFPWSSALFLRRQLYQGLPLAEAEEASAPDDPLRHSWRNGVALAQHAPSADPDPASAWQQDLHWVRQWAAWQAERPGARSWRERPEWITDYAMAGLHYAVEQDRHARSFRTQPGHPVRVQVVGPVRLRLEARPQHPTTTPPTPIEGWIDIRDQKQLWSLPVINNLPTAGVKLLGSEALLGRKLVWEQAFGPGLHELTIASTMAPLWVRVLGATPDPDLAPLPELSLTTLAAALEPRQPVSAGDLSPGFVDWLRPCSSCVALLPNQGSPRYLPAAQVRAAITPTPLSAAALERARSLLSALGAEQNGSYLGRLAASGDLEGLSQALEQEPPSDPVERMSWLVWLAEQRPAWLPRLLPVILALANDHPEHPALLALAGRVERNTHWLPWNAVSGGAGVRQITLTDWSPESPALRLRRQQVAPLRSGERLLGSGQVVTMEFNSQQPLPITLSMNLEEVALQPSVPLQVAVAVDEERPRILTMTPEQRQRNHPLTLPAGRHQVRVWVERGVVNQLLRLLVLEAGQPMVIPQERSYLVATPQEPVMVHLAGPTWVRIDEWRSGRTLIRHQRSDGRQPLRLQPAPGQSEALYRVFVKQVAPPPSPVPSRWLEKKPIPVPESPVTLPVGDSAETLHLTDGLPLGGQEDGTWSFAAGWQQRRNSEAKASGTGERFAEGSATWRHFDESARRWWQAGLLERIREQGNPSHGLFGRIDSRPLYPPLTLFAEEKLFAQELDQLGLKWSSRFRTGLSQWRSLDPKLGHEWRGALFWNQQEVDRVPTRLQGQVDQDLFSGYRHDHRYGLELGETVRFRPWLDSELRAEAGLASNEDFNLLDPDRLRWQAGWNQRVGPLLLEATYSGNHYRADQDRSQSHTRQELELAVGFEQWQPGGQRLEWRLSGGNDLGDGKVRALLELIWHESGGRGYRDFRPGEITLRDQREQHERRDSAPKSNEGTSEKPSRAGDVARRGFASDETYQIDRRGSERAATQPRPRTAGFSEVPKVEKP